MLSNFQQPSSLSFGNPVEGVQTIQGFTTGENLNTLIPAFKLPKRGGKPEDEKKKSPNENTPPDEQGDLEETYPEFLHFVMNVSFQEMIKFFLKPDHEQALLIRNKLLKEKPNNTITIISPTGMKSKKFEKMRDKLYMIQFQIFHTKKGLHFHVVI